MKKILALLLVCVLALSFVACGEKKTDKDADDTKANETVETAKTMSYDEFVAADLDAEVCVETYVQATQSWWDNKITVYTQNEDGAFFIYEMACSEEDAAKLVPGTKIVVTGYKAEWSGEVEIVDATFEFAGDDTFVAEAKDLTDLLGTEELINYQNVLGYFSEMTVSAIEFKNGEPGDDIYVTLTKGDNDYSFCVERYLTAPETEVYAAVSALNAGDVINVEGFVYWYEGVNTHITAIEVVSTAPADSAVVTWFEANKEGFMTGFEAMAGDTAEVEVSAVSNAIVIDMYMKGIDGATDEMKAEMQAIYDDAAPSLSEAFKGLINEEVPGLEYIIYNVYEEDGDFLADLTIEF